MTRVSLGVGAAVAVLAATGASAADLSVELEVPTQASAAYHKPYVAMWIERADGAPVGTLSVWYDVRVRHGNGTVWLRNLRSWWRSGGQALTLPADGVSGATRSPGRQSLRFKGDQGVLAGLPDGDYNLVVEAAREQGGREVVRTPFKWRSRARAARTETRAAGSSELGALTVAVLR
ncbi:DUF2271 domain-containing protein [Brevundimonas sp. SL130]|uniref:DUF2271 domain-containing protein n=1 Tax=Brevundimonas sp. SL130 TaxID=2995143 RepID=UPI00226CA202|nr:DUF2271 domain-containing protein [Brevundimonas sp. SL130]WAC61151.1 DUF2271 domain-containing protein [Brevundimonas sp. SL130]